MPESDRELCARLAEWMGKCLHIYGIDPNPSERELGLVDQSVQFIVYHPYHGGAQVSSVLRRNGKPFYPDIDPVAALELLDWLVERVRRPSIHFRPSGTWVGFYQDGGIVQHGILAYGLPSVAVPAAIARLADKVRESEVSDERNNC